MQSLLAVEVAYQIMRDRERQAAHSARAAEAARVAAQLQSHGPSAAQLWLAEVLRRLAVRLDPSVVCDPSPAAVVLAR